MYSYTSNIYSIHQLILILWNCINQGSHISVGDQSVWIQIWLLRRKGCDLCVLVTKYTPLHPHRVTMRIQTEMVNTKSSYRKDSVQWIPRPWNFVYILLTLNIEKCHLSNHPHICWGSCFLLWKREFKQVCLQYRQITSAIQWPLVTKSLVTKAALDTNLILLGQTKYNVLKSLTTEIQ